MKRALVLLVTVSATCAALPTSAAALIPGPNGPIVFTSARDDGATLFAADSSNSQIWVASSAGATPTRVTNNAAIQHRHATWSPDRTKIAYSAGNPATSDFDIWILDLTQSLSGTNPKDITNNPGISDDRPSWSPDGTKIAYATKAGGIRNIFVQNANGPQLTQLTNTVANRDADRPSWAPDGQTIFYSLDVDATAAFDDDIYKAPSTATLSPGIPVVTGSDDDYQPAVSPDGQSLCYVEGAFGSTAANIKRSTIAGTLESTIANSGSGDYNCAWSPDGSKITFVQGTFTSGDLKMRNSDGTGSITNLVPNIVSRFDGNPEWAPNPKATCSNASVKITPNSFANVPLTCTDVPDPLGFADNPINGIDIATPPAHGVLSEVISDKSVIYTPNKDFQGTDSFTYTGNDETSDSNPATVSITVANPPNAGGDKSAPSATLSGSTSQDVLKQKAVIVTVVVNEAAGLTGGGTLSVPGASKSFKLKGASANAAAGAKVRLKLKFSSKGLKAARKAIRKGKRVKANVTVTAKDAAGNAASFKRSIRSKAKKKR